MAKDFKIPKTMQALFLEKPGGPLVVRITDVPVPGRGEVLVKIAAAPVNPSDIAHLRGGYGEHDLNTFIPGIEGSGIVVAAGNGVLPWLWSGRRVACSSKYNTSGTWAEYMVTDAGLCFPLKKGVDYDQGAMTLVNPLTALAFFDIVKEGNHRALINNAAASALGRMVELLGKKRGIPVINNVRNQKQLEMLKSMGSEYVLNSSDPSFIEDLSILSYKLEATILFDSVCSSQLSEIIGVLSEGSRVIIYGNLTGVDFIIINPRDLIDRDITISGFYLGGQAKKNGILKNMVRLVEVGRLMSSYLKINIREKYPLPMAQEALESYLGNMSAGKVLLVP